mmetsp:Transcript_12954/g.15823  ORF Transcript_12954/g.15823 Transcript_12954/m.15823 type:complete len:101 (+) Transcript_12954:1771-2073(+)
MNGHARNDPDWTNVFNLTFVIASLSSDSSSETPERRKMQVTPNCPMNNSGLSIPPLTPREGNVRANNTALAIPSRKEFLFTMFRIFSIGDITLLPLLLPP